jgi:hypothetical protein
MGSPFAGYKITNESTPITYLSQLLNKRSRLRCLSKRVKEGTTPAVGFAF